MFLLLLLLPLLAEKVSLDVSTVLRGAVGFCLNLVEAMGKYFALQSFLKWQIVILCSHGWPDKSFSLRRFWPGFKKGHFLRQKFSFSGHRRTVPALNIGVGSVHLHPGLNYASRTVFSLFFCVPSVPFHNVHVVAGRHDTKKIVSPSTSPLP